MKIILVLEVDDPADVDADDSTGLTEEAHTRLTGGLSGFSIHDIRQGDE